MALIEFAICFTTMWLLFSGVFGFGHRTSPDFPGESRGIVWDPAKLTDSALASVSMGYQVAVTPLQMAAAVSSVANRGELLLYEDSYGSYAIAISGGNAGSLTAASPGDVVRITRAFD